VNPHTGVKQVVILGAQSAIGQATARLYAAEGARLVIAGRNEARLRQVGDDLTARGAAECRLWPIDLAAADATAEFAKITQALDDRVDAVLLFYGVLGDQREAERDPAVLRNIIAVNFASAAEWAVAAANQLEKQKGGALVAITSVAGDRGRQSNYVYGATKAGLTTLVEGIAHHLVPSGARAVAVKLGPVDTPMTANLKKSGPLMVKPDKVARIIKAIADRPSRPVVYAPWFWRGIMLIIRSVPTVIFHKTNL
jgi:decaprenylphospho-beta-D-erythro-pentofuranosid-2-ulose 2-reductase